VENYPKLLYWDSGFAGGIPRQYYKSYGLTASGLMVWLEKQILSTMQQQPSSALVCPVGLFACDFSDGVGWGETMYPTAEGGGGICVNEELVCNGVWDCRDGTDEQMCAEATTTVEKEEETQAVQAAAAAAAAGGGKEEESATGGGGYTGGRKEGKPTNSNVTAPPARLKYKSRLGCAFRCNDGSCQPSTNRCDGKVDCEDAIDESNCGVCKRTEHTCVSDGACVEYLKRCDGIKNCKDGSDEQYCKGKKNRSSSL
jgi:hypothetical protein